MKNKLKLSQEKATHRINILIEGNAYTKKELGNKIGLTQPTLRNRISKKNWKLGEIEIIKNLYPF